MPPQRSKKQDTSSNNPPAPYNRSQPRQANSQSDSKLNSRSFSGVSMVTILVGSAKTPFNVHMDLLCKASPFFKSAFMGSGNFKETSTKSMKLPEDDPATIDRLVQWIYFGSYPVASDAKTKSPNQMKELLDASLMQFATLYVTADKYGITELKNHVLDRLYKLAIQDQNVVTRNEHLIAYIYENTIAGSKLRKLLVDWHVWLVPQFFKTCWTEKEVLDHADFAADVLARFGARHCGKSNPFKSDASGGSGGSSSCCCCDSDSEEE